MQISSKLQRYKEKKNSLYYENYGQGVWSYLESDDFQRNLSKNNQQQQKIVCQRLRSFFPRKLETFRMDGKKLSTQIFAWNGKKSLNFPVKVSEEVSFSLD